jgi:hypothetical protein
MKRLLSLLFLLCAFRCAAQFIVTNEIDGAFDASSYDTDLMGMSHPFSTYFYDGYPQFTNHIYSWSRSGSSLSGDFEDQEGKYLMPIFNSFPFLGYDWGLANDNGSLNSNDTAVAFLDIASGPPLFFNAVAGVATNEGVPCPPIITQPLGRMPHDSSDGDSGAIVGNLGSMGAAASLGVPIIDMWHLMYTANFIADQAGARTMWSGIGGSHFTQGGYLAADIKALQVLGAETNVGSMTINFLGAAIAATNNCVLSGLSLAGNTLTLTAHFVRMPMAWDVPGTYGSVTVTNDARSAFVIYPELGNAFNWIVQVTNLPAGNYSISVDGILTDMATDAQLAAGRNWFTNYNGPLWAQRTEVLGRKRDQVGMDRVTLITHTVGSGEAIPGVEDLRDYQSNAGNSTEVYPAAYTGTNYVAHMQAALLAVRQYDVAIHNAAVQTNHTIIITLNQVRYAPFHR